MLEPSALAFWAALAFLSIFFLWELEELERTWSRQSSCRRVPAFLNKVDASLPLSRSVSSCVFWARRDDTASCMRSSSLHLFRHSRTGTGSEIPMRFKAAGCDGELLRQTLQAGRLRQHPEEDGDGSTYLLAVVMHGGVVRVRQGRLQLGLLEDAGRQRAEDVCPPPE